MDYIYKTHPENKNMRSLRLVRLQNAGACYKLAVYDMQRADANPEHETWLMRDVRRQMREGNYWMEQWEADLPPPIATTTVQSSIGPLTPTTSPGLFTADQLPGKPFVLTGFMM
jgi:hypothetical protein